MGIEIIPSPRPDDVPKPLVPGVRRMTMGEMMVWAAAWVGAAQNANPTLASPSFHAASAVCRLRNELCTEDHVTAFRSQVREG